jgi:site-specific DNA-adenine methylase
MKLQLRKEPAAPRVLQLAAPFPWFGGKSRAAHLVWERFGAVPNYVEPFAGSLAVLLRRPTPPGVETANDLDGFVTNFWRAVQADPEQVAHWADDAVHELNLHARHKWLVSRKEHVTRLLDDPEYCDAKVAGWWAWGICQWIGGGWCTRPEWKGRAHVAAARRGVLATEKRRPNLTCSNGVLRVPKKRPALDHQSGLLTRAGQLPSLSGDSGATGRGVTASALGEGAVAEWLQDLARRLRRVRFTCGDFSRVLSPNVTEAIGITGVLLDPPYSREAGRAEKVYAEDDYSVAHTARDWAIANGGNSRLRIALCGYEGEHKMPEGWSCVAWKAAGGYAAARGNTANALRERIWFSPHCQRPVQAELFGAGK